MDKDQIAAALADITAESDATVKHLKLASLVSALFRERGVELIVVGGLYVDLLVERVLMSAYPSPDESSAMCARKFIAVALAGHVEMDWLELHRLAEGPEYAILPELKKLVGEVAHELGKPSPYDTQGPSH